MPAIQEQDKKTTIEALASQAKNVRIEFVDGGFLGQHGGWLRFSGEGEKSLKELYERFGQEGIDTFNKTYVTSEFEQGIERRTHDLLKSAVNTPDDDDFLYRLRVNMFQEEESLRNLLKVIRSGGEVKIVLGEIDRWEMGNKYAQDPKEGAISIRLARPKSS